MKAQRAGLNFIETLLTQWRSSVGVLNPSPLNTWPRCPPQAAQVISVLLPSGSGWNKEWTSFRIEGSGEWT